MGKIYVVYKRGIYGQGVHGCSLDLAAAKKMADDLAYWDVDNYHIWKVYAVPLDQLHPSIRHKEEVNEGYMETQSIYSVQKSDVN